LSFHGFLSAKDNVSRSPNVYSTSPRIAVDSVGNIHVVYAEYYNETRGDAFYTKYDINNLEWSVPLNLSNSGAVWSEEYRSVGIDIDKADNIYVVYQQVHDVKLRIYSDGSWGPVIHVATDSGDVDGPNVAVDSNGNIYISWWNLDRVISSRARVNGDWEAVKVLAGYSKFPTIDAGTDVVFCSWSHYTGVDYQIYYTKRDTTFGASWSSPQPVFLQTEKGQTPFIKVDAHDFAHVVYTSLDDDEHNLKRVDYAYWTGNRFKVEQDVSAVAFMHYCYLYEREGNIYVCWQLGAFEAGSAIHYNTRINGTWTGEGYIPNSEGCTFSDIATSPFQDKIYVVWDAAEEIWCNMGETGTTETNKPPVAEFSFSPSTGIFPLEVTFDGSSSHDPDGEVVLYNWDFGDGTTGSGKIVKHTYTKWGTFSIRLTVRDNKGAAGMRAKNIEVLRLFQPLNIGWKTHADESLVMIRYVTEVTWANNPANDAIGAQIALYRVYRKKTGESDASYQFIGEVTGYAYKYLDKDAGGKDVYSYTVTSLDNQGHESPIVNGSETPSMLERIREPQGVQKRRN
jgi:PKD repeat protein